MNTAPHPLHLLFLFNIPRLLTLGAHAQKGYGTCLVCVSVCLSFTTPAPTLLVSTLKVRYVGVDPRLFLLFKSWIFDKSHRSEVMA